MQVRFLLQELGSWIAQLVEAGKNASIRFLSANLIFKPDDRVRKKTLPGVVVTQVSGNWSSDTVDTVQAGGKPALFGCSGVAAPLAGVVAG